MGILDHDSLLLLRAQCLELLRSVNGILGRSPDPDEACSPAVAGIRERSVVEWMGEMRGNGYRTNDLVLLTGDLAEDATRQLVVNGGDPIKLGRRQHLVLYILALPRVGRLPGRHGGYLPVASIVREIERIRPVGEHGDEFWAYPVPEDVHRVIAGLRQTLSEAGLDPKLLESGQRPAGYRLSTSSRNIAIGDGDDDALTAEVTA